MQGNNVQIVKSLERRRTWSLEEKAIIVSEAISSGTTLLDVARKYDVHPRCIYRWKKQLEAAKKNFLLRVPRKRGRPPKMQPSATDSVAPKPRVLAVQKAQRARIPEGVRLVVGELVITISTGGKS